VAWFSVRCVFEIGEGMYEERITIWQTGSADHAIELAEVDAEEYTEGIGRYLGLAQSFEMYAEPGAGAEIFSLIRSSGLDQADYLARFFSTGSEHTRDV
jgi:hypothetical protein